MRFLASADEIGNIKEIYCSRGVDTSKKDGKRPKLVRNFLQSGEHTNVRNRVVEFKQYNHNWLVVTRLGGLVSIYDLASELDQCALLHTYVLPVDKGDEPVSLLTFEQHEFMMVAFESGSVFVIRFQKQQQSQFLFTPLHLKLRQELHDLKRLTAFVANPYSPGVFACGGRNTDLQIIRMFAANKKFKEADFTSVSAWEPKVLFQAENVEPDHLGIECPIWISKILFQKDSKRKGFRLITATRHGHINKYDTVEDTEPIGSYKVIEKPIITLKFATELQEQIIISDTHTFVVRLSLVDVDAKARKIVSASAGTFYRPGLKLLGKYSEGGNTGAINGVDVSMDANIVAFGGLDRYLRVFDISTRKLLSKVYLGTQVSCLEIIDDENGEDTESSLEAKDEEAFWDNLESAQDNRGPKKRKTK